MYEAHVVSGGYMICDPQGKPKCVIYDGEFADQIVDALNNKAASDENLQLELKEVLSELKMAKSSAEEAYHSADEVTSSASSVLDAINEQIARLEKVL